MSFPVRRITASSVLPSPAVPPVFSSVSRFASYGACLVLPTILYIFYLTDTLLSQITPGTYYMFPQRTYIPSSQHTHLSYNSSLSIPFHWPPFLVLLYLISLYSCLYTFFISLAAFLISSLSSTQHCPFFVYHLILFSVYTTYHKLQALTTGLKMWLSWWCPGLNPWPCRPKARALPNELPGQWEICFQVSLLI